MVEAVRTEDTRVPAWPLQIVALTIMAGVAALLWLTRTPGSDAVWPRWTAIMLLAWWLPGVLIVALWRLPDLDLPTAAVVSFGTGWCWMTLGMLLLHWWPGPIGWPGLIGLFGAGALGLIMAIGLRPPDRPVSTPRRRWVWLLALVVLAAALRLPGLGYHEFHYDEVLVLTRAREAIRGEDDAFARHTKGPGELAAGTLVYATLGTVDEATARLPFGVMSVAAVPALALLGLRMFGARTGFWGGVLLAVNGFALGLSRIVQYQAGILLLMTLAVLAAWIFARRGHIAWLALSLLLSAFGTVLHYEFALIAPALLWLLWLGTPAVPRRVLWRTMSIALGAGAVLVAAAYLPIYLHPFFATTQSYLGSRMGGLGQTLNLAFLVEMGTFYNSIYFFAGLIGLVLTGLWLSRKARAAQITLLLWFLPYLLLYLFVIEFPGTHWYIFMPAWSLLAAVPLARWTAPNRQPRLPQVTSAAVVLWLIVSVNYLHLMFFRQDPAYLVNYATERNPFYWAPYGENVPEKPRFGFPINEGWKTLGVLSEWNYLTGTYASNERSRHVRWYAGNFERVSAEDAPDFIFVARHLQEPDPAFSNGWLDGYRQIGEVTVRDEPRIAVWARAVLPVPYVRYEAELFDGIFMGQAPTFDEWPDPPVAVQNVGLEDELTLLEGGAAPARLRRGEILQVRLAWRPERTPGADYKLFVHVAGPDGVPLAQWDGFPQLNTARTSTWQPGGRFIDRVLLPLPASMPPGSYTVLVGLYHPETGERLGGKAVVVTTVEVE